MNRANRRRVTIETPVYSSDIDALLTRWGQWLRAGSSGLSGVGSMATIRDHEYRDLVAEMLDQLVAQLPRQQKRAVIAIWYVEKSERQAADEWNMPRGRFKSILSNATGWLCGSLASRIDAAPTVQNVMSWEKRQK